MAQLKDTLIQGSARVTDTLYVNTLDGTVFSTNQLKLTSATSSVAADQFQISMNNNDTEYAAISYNTSGVLNIRSKRIIAISAAQNSATATPMTDYNTTTYYYFNVNEFWPGVNNTLALGRTNYRWSNIYSINGDFSGTVTISQQGGFRYTGMQTAGTSLSINRPIWMMAAASASALTVGAPVYNANLTYNTATNVLNINGSVYATNLYGTLNTTDINGVDATNGSLEKTLNQQGNWIINKRVFFGICDTIAATTAKTVTCAEFSDNDLVDGTIISVRFIYKNSGAVGSLTLNVNSTGAYPIKKMYASTGLTNLNNASELGANGVVTFVFNKISDSTAYWQVIGLDYNTNTNTNVTQDFSTATNYPRPLLLSNYKLGETSTSAAGAYRNDQIYANAGLGALYATSFHGALDYNDLTHTNATAGQVLTVNSTADGLVWATPSAGVSLASQTTQVYLTGAAQTTDTSLQLTAAYVTTAGALYSTTVHNAVWNDYAEYRAAASYIEPGRVVIDTDNGEVVLATKRLQSGAQVVSDTWGHIMGETESAKTPLAVAGRVLVYPYKDRKEYHAGMCVCSAPNGTVDIMTRDEIKEYPDCIVGIVSEIPDYVVWGSGNIKVNERIWIRVR